MRRTRREYQQLTKTGHERWLVSYADFITLLFAFFVVMYSVSQVSDQKYRVLSQTLASAFDGRVPSDAEIKELIDQHPLEEAGQVSGLSPVVNSEATEALATDLAQELVHMVKAGDVTLLAEKNILQINLSASALFASGSATPSEEAQSAFAAVAAQLGPGDYDVEVAGHTDNIPIDNDQFSNNWDLSAARATAIVRLLAEGGVEPSHLKAVGYGEYQPVADNSEADGRAQNRRVVLTVTRTVSQTEPEPSGPASEHKNLQSNASRVNTPQPQTVEPEQEAVPDNSDNESSDGGLNPVRLENGGLLFSSDPELPRSLSPAD